MGLPAAVLSAALVLGTALGPIVAQDRSTVVRVLQESHDFRARVRAALALGSSGDPSMADPLVRALSDESSAVRAAAAEGLGRLGNPSALAALRRIAHDDAQPVREAAERAIRTLTASAPATPAPPAIPGTPPAPGGAIDWAHTSSVVLVGTLENRSGFSHAALVVVMRQEVRRALGGVHGVVVLSASDPHADADREITARHLHQFRIEGGIRAVRGETVGRDLRVRAEVSLVLMDEPGRNIRASLNGAATGSEAAPSAAARPARERFLAEQATTGATRSAMSGAARALTSAGH
jgi:hypothetical protein